MSKKVRLLFWLSLITLSNISAFTTTTSPIIYADETIEEKMPAKKESRSERKKRKLGERQEALAQEEQNENFSRLSFNSPDSVPVLRLQNNPEPTKKVSFFCYPLVFTQEGIASFFNHSFNREEYGKEFLPHNLSHLSQIICHGKEAGLSKEFTEGAIRLFHQKMKAAPYISAPAIERFLDQTAPYLESQLAQRNFSLWSEIKDTLVGTFKSHFTFLQDDPLGFFDHVSRELDEKINLNVISPERTRATLVKFLTSGLDKVIWSPDDQLRTWESLKKIGNTLEYLHMTQVIPDPLDVNDLYWSLVERYCYFLELVGTKLNLETCQAIKRDLAEKNVHWLQAAEQEKGITTKLEKLAKAVVDTETRIVAQNNGIFTERIFTPSN